MHARHEMFMEVFETPIIFFLKLDTYLKLQLIEKEVKKLVVLLLPRWHSCLFSVKTGRKICQYAMKHLKSVIY